MKLKDLSLDKGNRLLNALKEVIVNNKSYHDDSHGLSIYFPYSKGLDLKTYSSFSKINEYSKFIDNFYNYKNNKVVNPFSLSDSKSSADKNTEGLVDFKLELTEEQLENYAKARYILFVKDKGSDYYTPIRNSYDVNLNVNILSASVRGKQLRAAEEGTEDSFWILLREEEKKDDYTKYKSSVIFQDFRDDKYEMNNGFVQITVDKDNPNGVITSASKASVTDDNGNVIPSSNIENISEFQQIVFLNSKYKILDENNNYIEKWSSTGELFGLEIDIDKLKFVQEDFSDEYEYYVVFQIWDTVNNSYYSNLIKMN